jgi:hypothetical protein
MDIVCDLFFNNTTSILKTYNFVPIAIISTKEMGVIIDVKL